MITDLMNQISELDCNRKGYIFNDIIENSPTFRHEESKEQISVVNLGPMATVSTKNPEHYASRDSKFERMFSNQNILKGSQELLKQPNFEPIPSETPQAEESNYGGSTLLKNSNPVRVVDLDKFHH